MALTSTCDVSELCLHVGTSRNEGAARQNWRGVARCADCSGMKPAEHAACEAIVVLRAISPPSPSPSRDFASRKSGMRGTLFAGLRLSSAGICTTPPPTARISIDAASLVSSRAQYRRLFVLFSVSFDRQHRARGR
ncbi:hypothetical protein [Paraburkholderia sp. SOS3]|uniref:hypothetical protein n=1 Tax=Paraburkholderia sp. SOS3 TaxID=1926494 RepID=UPI0018DCEBED|nr:hypothetical protein [Paraburkholderia sp. SOS3]